MVMKNISCMFHEVQAALHLLLLVFLGDLPMIIIFQAHHFSPIHKMTFLFVMLSNMLLILFSSYGLKPDRSNVMGTCVIL